VKRSGPPELYQGVGPTAQRQPTSIGFESFVDNARVKLRKALVARYGPEVGSEAAAEAIAYAWQHWNRVSEMENAVGYLYRVAQTSVRRHHRWRRTLALPPERPQPDFAEEHGAAGADLGLHDALARLRPDERVAVVLVHGYAWAYQEVADLLDVPVSTVRNHVHRGLNRLRNGLEMT
jgi:RNA polymerase sigma-70 factor (ECF subfamily)